MSYLKDIHSFLYKNKTNIKTNPNEVGEKKLYNMNLPNINQIKLSNFGQNIIQITEDFGFKGNTIANFSKLFTENACEVLAINEEEYFKCIGEFFI